MTGGNEPSATRAAAARVALVTCADLPDLDPDDRLLIAPLAEHGIRAEATSWDARLDWDAYLLAVLRSPWDYVPRHGEFLAWTRQVPRLANPADVVAWNTDKRYLAELTATGVPTVPTHWLAPGQRWAPASPGEYVIKPAVGAGSVDAGRYRCAGAQQPGGQDDLARAHVDRLHAAGRTVLVQPYLPAVASHGETALIFFGGPEGLAYSHAIRKGPLLAGPDEGTAGLFRAEQIEPRQPSAAELRVAGQVLAAVPSAGDLLYARVDLIPGPDGEPLLVELELTEPSLFLAHAPGAAARFADAIAHHTGRRGLAGTLGS
ncbi:ATP-grasp domain-containing protein [Solwaraspora sp. WMMB335]|uniref:ATP-grasp domain-containing protein n=1 Tax=Solwaraspora sp. WMMB335 TaxID=3404118 RepID=UPI003B95FB6C